MHEPSDPSDPFALAPGEPDYGTLAELRERALLRLAMREDAERRARAQPPDIQELERTLHELRVHEIELELQNEELRRTQLDLEASRQRWFELYDLAPVGYCTLNERGVIDHANLAAAELVGLPRSGLARRRLTAFIEHQDQAAFLAAQQRAIDTGEGQSTEVRMTDTRHVLRWVQLTIAPAPPDARGARALRVVLVDVSARRKAQTAEARLQLAEQSHRNRSQLLSRVGHEFRTPLNAILGFSQLLLRSDDAAPGTRRHDQLSHIHDAAAHLLKMVTDLLDIPGIAAGQSAVRSTSVDLLDVLRHAVADVAAAAEAAGVAVALEADADLRAAVMADPTRLRQVVQNLLSNAVKYNHRGGRVTVKVSRQGGCWRVSVVDDGLGMTEAQQAALFQPFNRLGRDAAGIEGTGLGLVIARDLVEAMGGRLSVHSAPGEGSEFMVDVWAAELAPEAAPPAGAGEPSVREDITGRVLCVDDDRANRELIRGVLEWRPGLELELVQTGADAITAARRRWPDLLLLDLNLSDMPGLDVLKVLRQINPHRAPACIVVSAEDSEARVKQAREAGANEHIAKPVDVVALLASIDRQITRLRASAQGGSPPAARDGGA